MIRQRRHPASTQRTSRLEAYTDGVFAIAATLLVLDLTQHSLGEVDSDAEMWTALVAMSELFLNFALSFVLLSLMWMVHVQQFEHVARVDAAMVWLNNARLLFIVLVPFRDQPHHGVLRVARGAARDAGDVLPGDPLQLAAVELGGASARGDASRHE